MEETAEPIDKVSFFKLSPRDLQRVSGQTTAADLGLKQLAYCICFLFSFVLPADLLEIGGECETLLKDTVKFLTYAASFSVVIFDLNSLFGTPSPGSTALGDCSPHETPEGKGG